MGPISHKELENPFVHLDEHPHVHYWFRVILKRTKWVSKERVGLGLPSRSLENGKLVSHEVSVERPM